MIPAVIARSLQGGVQTRVAVLLICSTFMVLPSATGQVAITSFGRDGILVWTNDTTNVTYQIEWTGSPIEEWRYAYESLTQIQATSTTMSAAVPLTYRVSAIPIIDGMAFIPPGAFLMGDSLGHGEDNERPPHEVFVSGFHMDLCEVSNEEMRDVMQWAYETGKVVAVISTVINTEGTNQELLNLDGDDPQIHFAGGVFTIEAGTEAFPCYNVSWYGAAAYCNFLSEMEGLTPCYDLSDWSCDWNADGYRLPTEAEWEKAARGGLVGQSFPWASNGANLEDDIYDSKANYQDSVHPYTTTTPVGYYNGSQISPIGPDMANGYGLYDMAGNVWEWCWDWHEEGWYTNGLASVSDTVGPASGIYRIYRGGAWGPGPDVLRCAKRGRSFPYTAGVSIGLRAVRRH